MSLRTTNFGPRVSFTTTQADAGPVHVRADSDATVEILGSFTIPGLATAFTAAMSGNTATLSFATLGKTFTFKSDTSAS